MARSTVNKEQPMSTSPNMVSLYFPAFCFSFPSAKTKFSSRIQQEKRGCFSHLTASRCNSSTKEHALSFFSTDLLIPHEIRFQGQTVFRWLGETFQLVFPSCVWEERRSNEPSVMAFDGQDIRKAQEQAKRKRGLKK